MEIIQSLMPEVVKNFGEHKLKGEFIAFLKLVAVDRIPMDNIALLLLFDVVRRYSLGNTKTMTYPETTKLFWEIGMELFHGSFLNFNCHNDRHIGINLL